MAAFAANSVLTRAGVGHGLADAVSFGSVRLAAGAAMLWLLLMLRRKLADGDAPGVVLSRSGRWHLAGAVALLGYLYAFSWAYAGIATGTGALILFGSVQLTMFCGAVVLRDPPSGIAWVGSGVALCGLAVLVAPGAAPLGPALAMVVAGMSWGIYSLIGRRGGDALGATASQFVIALPVGFLLMLSRPPLEGTGLWLAIASGALASGLGYALWYAVLPQLTAGRAAVAQLSVPLIAAAFGWLLGEALDWRFAVAALLVLGGLALASYWTISSSGS